jgi:hypothetical protein
MRTTLCLLVAAAVANRHAEQPHLDVFQGAAEFVRLDEKLTVHMVHHTHDDVGWLKTVDEYFSGTDKNVQRAQVKLIIDSMIEELLKDENKRFSYVEMKFFQMWWRTQSEDMKK